MSTNELKEINEQLKALSKRLDSLVGVPSTPEVPKGYIKLKDNTLLKWNPGHYFKINTAPQSGITLADVSRNMTDLFSKFPKIQGFKLLFFWSEIEGDTPGSYNWENLDALIKNIPEGKSVILEMRDRTFGSGGWYWAYKPKSADNKMGFFPKYLVLPPNEPPTSNTQKYLYMDTMGQIMPRMDNPSYLEHYIRVLSALGLRYNDNPKVVGVRYVNETAQALPSNKTPDGIAVNPAYKVDAIPFRSGLRAAWDIVYNQVEKYWPNTMLFMSYNWYPGSAAEFKAFLDRIPLSPRKAMNWPDGIPSLSTYHYHLRLEYTSANKRLWDLERDGKVDKIKTIGGIPSAPNLVAHQILASISGSRRYTPHDWDDLGRNIEDGDIIISDAPEAVAIYKNMVGKHITFESGVTAIVREVVESSELSGWNGSSMTVTQPQLWAMENKGKVIMALNQDGTEIDAAAKSKIRVDWDGVKNFSKDSAGIDKLWIYKTMDVVTNIYETHYMMWPSYLYNYLNAEAPKNYLDYIFKPVMDHFNWAINTNPPKDLV